MERSRTFIHSNTQTNSPYPASRLKRNVDASFDPLELEAAIAGVLRGCNANFMCVFSSPIPPIEINSTEVFAIKRAIQVSITFNLLNSHSVTIESDSTNVVQWCNQTGGGPWNLCFSLNVI